MSAWRVYTCRHCGQQPCVNPAFCRLSSDANLERLGLLKSPPPRARPLFAESTIEATVWLMRFHPERLPAWLARHDRADVLAFVARKRIESANQKANEK